MEPALEAFDELLRTVDLHHGQYGQNPPYGRLEVYGHMFDDFARDSLAGVGFELEALEADHFTARRAIDDGDPTVSPNRRLNER